MGSIKSTAPFRYPAPTPKFRGELAFSNLKANGTSIISPFADLPLAFEDVPLENCRFETPKPLNDLFVACQETAKKVRVCRIFFSEFRSCRVLLGSNLSDAFPDENFQTPFIGLSPCKGLEEISSNSDSQVTGSSRTSRPSPRRALKRSRSTRIFPPQPQISIQRSTFTAGPGWT